MTLVSSVVNLPLLTACSQSSEDVDEIPVVENALIKNHDGTETLILSTGEQIVLEDTVTHIVNFTGVDRTLGIVSNACTIESRAIAPTGYDRAVIQKDNKKYLLKGLESYGISPTTVYIGKFNTYYKELPVSQGYTVVPQTKKCAENKCMGFIPSTYKIGFSHIDEGKAGYETGITQIFYVAADVSGIAWNKNIPCNPQNLIWYYTEAILE